jgi:hypothetical protein
MNSPVCLFLLAVVFDDIETIFPKPVFSDGPCGQVYAYVKFETHENSIVIEQFVDRHLVIAENILISTRLLYMT